MCANYGIEPAGLGPGGEPGADRASKVRFVPLSPLDEEQNAERMRRWAEAQRGSARITGRRARNLNPVIHAARGERELALAWWWLHVGGEPAPYSAFNSRDDKLLRSWREAFQRRVLLPAHWYIEKGARFGLPGGEMFGIAAIASLARQPDGSGLLSYSMVTRSAVARAETVHDRMPLVLPRDAHDAWLDPGRVGDAALLGEVLAASTQISGELVILAESEARSAAHARAATMPPPAPPQPTLF